MRLKEKKGKEKKNLLEVEVWVHRGLMVEESLCGNQAVSLWEGLEVCRGAWPHTGNPDKQTVAMTFFPLRTGVLNRESLASLGAYG